MPRTTKKRLQRSLPLRLTLPATSANLGPAFDAAALAMDLHLTIDARLANDFSIHATGRDSQICQALQENLILTTYCEILEQEGIGIIPLAFRVKNEIPIGKGCGSSAAARVAAVALANYFGRMRWSDSRIIGETSHRERHPDNAAACWMGGLTIARMSSENEAQVACIRPKGKWPLLLAIPEESLPTEKARGVLPENYSRADAVLNIQNSLFLLAAFTQGRTELLAPSLEDRIHQPYRAPLCPLLPILQQLTGTPGVLGTALSGAGPSVIVFLDPACEAQKTKRAIAAHLQKQKLPAELLLTSIAPRGARG
ncbi:MAG TPA: homoserine kinase [Candidatus Sulfotelmatobacter sp.]|jgi:homoserine kinase